MSAEAISDSTPPAPLVRPENPVTSQVRARRFRTPTVPARPRVYHVAVEANELRPIVGFEEQPWGVFVRTVLDVPLGGKVHVSVHGHEGSTLTGRVVFQLEDHDVDGLGISLIEGGGALRCGGDPMFYPEPD